MAGDSGSAYGEEQKYDSVKVARVGKFLIGASGAKRVNQLVLNNWAPPEPPSPRSRTLLKWMTGEFAASLQARLGEAGFDAITAQDGTDTFLRGNLLVGYDRHLFYVCNGLSVTQVQDYSAIGSACDVAMGSLFTSKGTPQHRLRTALRAAEKHILGIKPPYKVLST